MTGGLLLLDVDGPLNPYAASRTRRPGGCTTYRGTPSGGWHTGRAARRFMGLRVWLNPGHGARLLALAAEFTRLRAGAPTLLCHVDPGQGPGSTHLAAVRRWA